MEQDVGWLWERPGVGGPVVLGLALEPSPWSCGRPPSRTSDMYLELNQDWCHSAQTCIGMAGPERVG